MLNNPRGSKYLVVVMETLEGCVDGLDGLRIMNVTADEIAEFNEIAYSTNHFDGDMTLNCWQVHLHEGLRIIFHLLLESLALDKMA